MLHAFRREVSRLNVLDKSFHRSGVFAGAIGPGFPRGVEGSRLFPSVRIAGACFVDPRCECVLAFKVSGRGARHGCRRRQALSLPFHAARDHPSEDAGPFCAEVVPQSLVALVRWKS